MSALDQAVERALINPLPHHLCTTCNPARRVALVGPCPKCGKREAMLVKYDGQEWPLELFLSAYRYQRTDGEVPDFAGEAGSIDVLWQDGRLEEGAEALTIDWGNVLAIHAPETSLDFGNCPACDVVVPITWQATPGPQGSSIVITTPHCSLCEYVPEWLL